MSNNHQVNPDYQLVSGNQAVRPHRKLGAKVWFSLLLALALITGALYGPMVFQTSVVNAASPLMQAAQTLPVDASLAKDQDALAQLYNQIAPSVVSIQVTSKAEDTSGGFQLPNIPGLPRMPGTPNGDAPLQQGEGSGFIFDNDGHIVTNNHVVDGATSVNVVFNDGHWAKAEVVATDPQADLAVIKVTPPADFTWRPLPLAKSDSLKVGYTVIAMGNPFGLEGTMTTGIVSALGRGMPVGQLGPSRYTLPDVIQTDAAINPGNSGGPLINLAGEVVGVNFAIESPSRSNSGVGFTIPVSIVSRVVPELIKDGKFDYAYLGLSGVSIGPDLAEQLKLDNKVLGVYVGGVVANGPADKAGVQGGDNRASTNGSSELQAGGDIITAINDQPVHRFEDLVSYLITKAAPGDKVSLSIIRDGKSQKIDVVLGARPDASSTAAKAQAEGPVSARQAIEIASDAAKDSLKGDITQTVVSPDRQKGQDVWVVELTTDSQTATVTIARETGEVLNIDVK